MTTEFRTHDGRTLQQAASDLVQREVLCCMSSMVATLASGECMNPPRVRDYPHAELIKQAAHLAAPVLDYEGAAREAGWSKAPDGEWIRAATDAERAQWVDDGAEGELQSADNAESACALDNIDPYESEVFEHWAVSTWFAEKLTAAGERVDTDFAGLNVWARTTTGQAISIDAVVERITREMHAA